MMLTPIASLILGWSMLSTGIILFSDGSEVDARAARASAEELSLRGIPTVGANCYFHIRSTRWYSKRSKGGGDFHINSQE